MVRCLALAVALTLAATYATAGQPPSPRAQPPAETRSSQVSVDRLPIDLQRIERELHRSASADETVALNLRYMVNVYGQAPRVQLFTDEELVTGPAPYAMPTHKDMVDVMTPREWRAPVMDLGAVARWISEKMK